MNSQLFIFNEENFSKMEHFILNCDKSYEEQLKQLPLFDSKLTREWEPAQKKAFAKIFFHLRGHFYKFLWIMGNFAPEKRIKEVILKNIMEEFGEDDRPSHETLYMDFAKALGVDITEEIISEKNYLQFAKDFNNDHVEWLITHSWNEKLAAFSAYERLDNVDYTYLYKLAQSLGISNKHLTFFRIHMGVKHYDSTISLIENVWEQDPKSIINGYYFIYSRQFLMWRELSDYFFENENKIRQQNFVSTECVKSH